MGSHYIITVTREFGSMGRPIARKLSELLGIEFYDRDIVEKTAKEMSLPMAVVSKNEENLGSTYSKMRFPLGKRSLEIQDEIFSVQSDIILKLASSESCVIVGRCADYVLKDFKNCINIYIFADYEKRIENCREYLGMEERVAIQMISEVDKARKKYHKRYANYYPSDTQNKNLMIDSGFLGVDGTAKLIADIVHNKYSNT